MNRNDLTNAFLLLLMGALICTLLWMARGSVDLPK